MSPLVGQTGPAADILPALGLVVVAIGVAQTATGGRGRAVVIIAPLAQRLWVEVLVAPVVVTDGDATMIMQPAVVVDDIMGGVPQMDWLPWRIGEILYGGAVCVSSMRLPFSLTSAPNELMRR